MFKKDNPEDILEQPLMSTGTTEAGFEAQTPTKQKPVSKPKIGETFVGERRTE